MYRFPFICLYLASLVNTHEYLSCSRQGIIASISVFACVCFWFRSFSHSIRWILLFYSCAVPSRSLQPWVFFLWHSAGSLRFGCFFSSVAFHEFVHLEFDTKYIWQKRVLTDAWEESELSDNKQKRERNGKCLICVSLSVCVCSERWLQRVCCYQPPSMSYVHFAQPTDSQTDFPLCLCIDNVYLFYCLCAGFGWILHFPKGIKCMPYTTTTPHGTPVCIHKDCLRNRVPSSMAKCGRMANLKVLLWLFSIFRFVSFFFVSAFVAVAVDVDVVDVGEILYGFNIFSFSTFLK